MPVCWLGVIREYEPIKPPIEEPDEPITTPSTDDIIKTKIGDIDMIVGSNIWRCITYGNGKYVVGNNQGQITTSTDGKTWATPKTIPNIKVFSDIVYDNSKFVAVSYFGASKGQGYITTSTDGVNWTTTTPYNVSWRGVIYAASMFVAACNDAYIAYSTDGVTWTINQYSKDYWQRIAYGNGKFVVLGTNGYSMTSTDGKSWTTPVRFAEFLSGRTWQDIIFANGKFIAVAGLGYISTSTDGINWTTPEQIKDESGKVVTATLNGVCAMP